MQYKLFEVGKPFSGRNSMPGQDFSVADITSSFFNIHCFASNLSPDEIHTFRRGKFKYGVFEMDDIPFFIVDFGDWSFDISINVLKIKSNEDMDAWLNSEGNLITMVLIDTNTNIVKAIRAIGIQLQVSKHIKDILERQSNKYKDANEAEIRIAQIAHTLTTAQMSTRTKMKRI